MTHATLRILREEHAALKAVLRQLQQQAAFHRREGTLPEFGQLRALLFHIDEFLEKGHHRRESERLFPKLRARAPLSRELLDRLDADHGRGERRVRYLEHDLLAFEMLGEPRREAFEQALRHYVDFYLGHMALEEQEVLPLAERVLTGDDWAELDEAFVRESAWPGHPPGHAPGVSDAALLSRIARGASRPAARPASPEAAQTAQELAERH